MPNFNREKFLFFSKKYSNVLFQIAFITSVLGMLLFIADFGFDKSERIQKIFNSYYFVVIVLGILATILRYFERLKKIKRSVIIFDVVTILATLIILFAHFLGGDSHKHISFLYNDNW
ncbi:MAG TPA: ATPase, partial [Mariniflexile sp.]